MKKPNILLSSVVCGLLVGFYAPPLAASDAYQVTGVAAADTLNIRNAPRASSADLGDYFPGQTLQVYGYDATRKWAVVMLNGQQAFISMRYITLLTAGPATAASLGMNKVVGIAASDPDGGLVVRNGPGVTNTRLFVVPNNVSFNIVEISVDGKWSRAIFSDGGTGWVRNSYLSPHPVVATPPPPTPPIVPTPQAGSPDFPAVYSVINIRSGQTLKVRTQPSTRSPAIAQLALDAPVSVLEISRNHWAKVVIGQNTGYVKSRFLTEGGGTVTLSGMQLGLTCTGTEPFWALDITTDRTMTFEAMGGAGPLVSTLQVANSAASGIYPVQFSDNSQISGILSAEICSDGMSDITYPWKVLLSAPVNGSYQTLSGCCTLQ